MFEKDDPSMTASPVYFASAGYRQFYWMSTLDEVD